MSSLIQSHTSLGARLSLGELENVKNTPVSGWVTDVASGSTVAEGNISIPTQSFDYSFGRVGPIFKNDSVLDDGPSLTPGIWLILFRAKLTIGSGGKAFIELYMDDTVLTTSKRIEGTTSDYIELSHIQRVDTGASSDVRSIYGKLVDADGTSLLPDHAGVDVVKAKLFLVKLAEL
jgi:hypothetical protein